MSTEFIMILTIILFLLVFGLLYIQLHRSTSLVKIWYFIFLFIAAGPLTYMLYDDYTHSYLDANIGLGLAYFYTWFMVVLAAVLSVVCYYRRK